MNDSQPTIPAVSVVIATYNYGQFLAGALDSVLAQTFTDWEAIIVDDGSTDDTPEVVRPYLGDERIRYERTDHLGQPGAKNVGIRLSRSPLVAFLDADDLWLPSKLERQVALFHNDPELGVVYSRRLWMDEQGRMIESPQPELYHGEVLAKMFKDNFVCFSSSMVRRAVFDEVGAFDERIPLAIDYDLWLRVAQRYRFDYVDEPLVLYRTGHANLSQRGEERLFIALAIMRRFLDERGGRNSLDRRTVRRAYAETYLHIGQAKARRSRLAALPWFARSLAQLPVCLETWKELVKLCLPQPVFRALRRALGRPNDAVQSASVAPGGRPATAPTARDPMELPTP
ncbi:MAG: glycosyltransferase family 2 protein [Pirellulales bacterium]